MSDTRLISDTTPAEYFKNKVQAVIAKQGLLVGDLTEYYLVNLLWQFVRPRPEHDLAAKPMALQLCEAIQKEQSSERRTGLRNLGDLSLFMTGFFSDGFIRRSIDVDYYIATGVYAYGMLSRKEEEAFGEVFEELALNFVACTDVLAEISEPIVANSNQDTMRLYEKWLRTGSKRYEKLLAAQGIIPNASIGSRFIQ